MIPAGQKCCEKVHEGYRTYGCRNKAKVERDGKFYCGVHDPEKAKAKRAARDAKLAHEYKIRECKSKLQKVRDQISDEIIRTSYLPLELIDDARKLRLELDALLAVVE